MYYLVEWFTTTGSRRVTLSQYEQDLTIYIFSAIT